MEPPVTEAASAAQRGNARSPRNPASDQWRVTIAAVTFGLAAVIAMYWEPTAAAVSVWTNNATYRASYLIIPVALYFIWLRRGDVAPLVPRPYAPGLVLTVFFGLIGVVSNAADVLLGQQLAVVGSLQALLLTVLGWRIFKALLFPFMFLWLLVPAEDFMIPILMRLITSLTVSGVGMAGLPAEAEGNLIKVLAERYSVVEECAALDFLIGALIISLVFGALMYRSFAKRLVLVLAALIIAIVANAFRTTTVILITHFSAGEIDLASDHQTYGWVVFLVATVVLMWGGALYRDRADNARNAPPGPEPGVASAVPARVLVAVVAVIIVAGAAPTYAALSRSADKNSGDVTLCLPASSGPWRRTEASDWRPVVPGAGGRFHRSYAHEGKIVDLYIAYFARQRQGAELVGWGNRIADGKTWIWLSEGGEHIRVDGDPVRTAATRMGTRKRRRLVWHWYWVDGEFTGSRVLAKLLQAKATLLRGDRRAALVAVSAEEHGNRQNARVALRAFLDATPSLGALLARAAPETASCPGR